MVNLILALLWLLVAGFLFVWPVVHPEVRMPTLMGSDLSLGWAALALCIYNSLRAWFTFSAAAARRRQDRAEQTDRPKRIVNPTFDFTERPPRP